MRMNNVLFFVAGGMVGATIAVLFMSCFLIGRDWE